MKDKINVTEKDTDIIKDWYDDARTIRDTKSLTEFIDKLTTKYNHDYGTICHAMTACAIAALWTVDNSESGGITGFQAGAIMWEFITHWNYTNNKVGLKLIDYDNLLYPQYADKFKNTISSSQFKLLQKTAEARLIESPDAHITVINHWQNIIDGVVPFDFIIHDEA